MNCTRSNDMCKYDAVIKSNFRNSEIFFFFGKKKFKKYASQQISVKRPSLDTTKVLAILRTEKTVFKRKNINL